MLSKAVSEQKVGFHDLKIPPEIERQLRTVGPDLEILDKKFIYPILNARPSEVEGMIKEQSSSFNDFYGNMIRKFIANFGKEDVLAFRSVVFSFLQSLRRQNTVYSDGVMQNFIEALELEIQNENFGMRNLLMKTPEEFLLLLSFAKIDVNELMRISGHLYLSLFTSLQGIILNRKEYEPVMQELTKLALAYSEEKDSQFTTLQIMLDKEARNDLDEAYAEYQKTVAK